MQLQGRILSATTALDGSWFEKAEIFITENNENGSLGFVINKLFPRKLNELEEFKNESAIDLYYGGPVDNDHIYFIHKTPDLQGKEIMEHIYFGGDFHEAARLLSNGMIPSNEIKIFIGYCGWDNDELEREIEEGSWEVKKEYFHF